MHLNAQGQNVVELLEILSAVGSIIILSNSGNVVKDIVYMRDKTIIFVK